MLNSPNQEKNQHVGLSLKLLYVLSFNRRQAADTNCSNEDK